MFTRRPHVEVASSIPKDEVDDLPIPVVADWGRQVRRANGICQLIDEHLDAAEQCPVTWMEEPPPWWWSPKRRVRVITDLRAAIRRGR